MIHIEVEYPWGKKDIKYDKWVLRRYVKKTDPKTQMTETLTDETRIAKTDDEYAEMLWTFQNDLKNKMSISSIQSYNSHYYEYEIAKDEVFVEYIQGFLSEIQ